MAIKEGLRTLLLAQSSITTLCPVVFVEKVKQGVKPPYIRITDAGHDPMKCLDGTYGMGSSEIYVECVEFTEPESEAIATAVTAFIKDYSGDAGGSDTIDAVLWDDKQTFIRKEDDDGKDVWRYNARLALTVQHH